MVGVLVLLAEDEPRVQSLRLREPNQVDTATLGPTRPNGWISIHVVGNLTSVDGIPTIRWKSIQRMKIPSGIGWISHHVPQNGWIEIQTSLSHMAKLGGGEKKDVSNLLNLS